MGQASSAAFSSKSVDVAITVSQLSEITSAAN
jgi:hypothetical protein